MTLLELKNVTVKYKMRHTTFTAIQDVSLTLEKGEILGVVGESGAGKSTVGNAIIGLLEGTGYIDSGAITLNGQPYDATDENSMKNIRGDKISIIFQDPMTSLNPLLTIEKQLLDTILQHSNLTKEQAQQKAMDYLLELEIPEPEKRIKYYPHQLSGGQRQRIVIALALCTEPDVIVADEPTTALDVSVQAQILNILKKLTRKHNVGIIMITHDMGVVKDITDRVVVMYKGKVIETGNTQDILGKPQQEYTKSLIAAVPPADKKIDRFVNVSFIEQEIQSEKATPQWLLQPNEKQEKGEIPNVKKGDKILSVQNISMDFIQKNSIFTKNRSYFRALDSVSFDMLSGENLGIVGESGSGKSTVAKVITGLYKASEGKISYKNQNITEHGRKGFSQEIQMIFQDPYSSLNNRMTIEDILSETFKLYNPSVPKSERAKRILDIIDLVGLATTTLRKSPHAFSGGQRQRISIARALTMQPRFLICDEPTSALDVSVQAQILNLLKDLQSELHLTLLFISHDLPVIRQMCDKVIVMKSGKVIENRPTEDLFNNPEHEYTKTLINLMPGKKSANF